MIIICEGNTEKKRMKIMMKMKMKTKDMAARCRAVPAVVLEWAAASRAAWDRWAVCNRAKKIISMAGNNRAAVRTAMNLNMITGAV